jgi:uncharacterized protein YdeI (YjbR/CyaY-like superfamily)
MTWNDVSVHDSGSGPDPGRMGGSPERPARFFTDASEFGAWLARHHDTAPELWMGLNKKHVAERGLTWADAVPEALCWGWIDSVVQRIDEDAVRQRWTPRRKGSNWSRINLDLVERLTAAGRMQPSGLRVHAERKRELAGYSYESPTDLPAEHLALMNVNAAAAAFWAESTPSYQRACIAWVLTAKQEATRERRMRTLIDDHAHGRLIPPQRYGELPKWVARAAAAAFSAS